MKLFYKNIIFFLFLSSSIFGQSLSKERNDDSIYYNRNLSLTNSPLHNSEMFKNRYIDKLNILYGFNKNSVDLTNSLLFSCFRKNDFMHLNLYPNVYFQNSDQIEKSKKELNRILALKYKEQNKYDLGKIGVYLGLSKNVTAIILAIISIM